MKGKWISWSHRMVASARPAGWRRPCLLALFVLGSVQAMPARSRALSGAGAPADAFSSGGPFHFWLHIAPYLILGLMIFGIVLSRFLRSHDRDREIAQEMIESERLRLIEDRARAAERRAHQFIMSDVNGILVADADGVIIMTNPALDRLFKYDPGELQGQRVEILVPEVAKSKHERLRSGYVSAPERRRMMAGRPLEGCAKDGSMIPIEISLSSTHGPEGLSVMATVIDISERVRAEEKLRQMANVFESTGEGIVITNAKFRIVNTNPAFTAITGYEADEVLGRNYCEPWRATRRRVDRDRCSWI